MKRFMNSGLDPPPAPPNISAITMTGMWIGQVRDEIHPAVGLHQVQQL